MLRDRNNGIHNTIESRALIRSSPSELARPPFENNLCANIFYFFNKSEPAGLGEVLIDSTDTSPENAVDRDAQCRCFAIHGPPAANDQVRIPDQIQSIHGVFGNDDASFVNRIASN